MTITTEHAGAVAAVVPAAGSARVITDYADLVALLRPLRYAQRGRVTTADLAGPIHCSDSLVRLRELGDRVLNVPAAIEHLRALGVQIVVVAAPDAPAAVKELLAQLSD